MKRIEWIDIFKGILIFLVIFGHAAQGIQSNENVLDYTGYGSISFVKNVVYSFHMPAFFVASGLLFNNLKEKLNKKYLIRKLKQIIYPYFVWSFITAAFMQIAGGNTNSGLGLKDFLYSPIKPFSQYWYLYVYLFFILTYALCIYLFKNRANKILLGLGLVTYLMNPFIPDIWILKNYCNYLIYFSFGLSVIKLVKSKISLYANPKYAFFTGTMFIIFSFIYAYEIIIDKSSFTYFLWLVPSTLGTAFFINVSFNIKSRIMNQIFIHLGKNSLSYYVMHLIPLAAIRIMLLNYMHIENLWLVLSFSFIIAIFSCFLVLLTLKRLKLTKIFFGSR